MQNQKILPRPEFPRPDFERKEWLNLNGTWEFEFDENDLGISEKWQSGSIKFTKLISVPFCYQSKASGIGIEKDCPTVWYRRTFTLPTNFAKKRILLKFGAVDYDCKVWINGIFVGQHVGGYTPFEFEITNILVFEGENTITVRVVDQNNPAQPRGKQTWRGKRFGCWYTPTTGIWQSVWLEAVGDVYIQNIKITPDLDRKSVLLDFTFNKVVKNMRLLASVILENKIISKREAIIQPGRFLTRTERVTIDIEWPDELDNSILWSPENPNLFNLDIVLLIEDSISDRVQSYFGFRKIEINNGRILINNIPYTLKLILDQGYWPESLLTPPSDEAIIRDITAAKGYGFNGARKHQKTEDPRFYYWADRLGFFVWNEMPSNYRFSEEGIAAITREWQEIINRDYNHPSIIAWVPFNESWGLWNIYSDSRMQAFSRAIYWLTKALDHHRIVSANDGWEQVESDICAIHDYDDSAENFNKKIEKLNYYLSGKFDWRMIYAKGFQYQGEPIILTEYGGIAFENKKNHDEWGYRKPVKTEDEFISRFESITRTVLESGKFVGICYTQLTDVMQEVNGLLDENRKPKVSPEKIKEILDSY